MELLSAIIVIAATAVINAFFYLRVQSSVNKALETHKISYSEVFKEKILIYKSLLTEVYDLKLKLHNIQLSDDQEFKLSMRADFNRLIKLYTVNRPFLSDTLVELFEGVVVELEDVYESIMLADILEHLSPKERADAEKAYYSALNRLRQHQLLEGAEEEIISEIKNDLQAKFPEWFVKVHK